MNVVILRGSVARVPDERALPSGDRVVAYDVRTELADGSAETVPVVSTPPPDGDAFDIGDEVVVTGRVRRRFYRVGGATQSRTEVVAQAIVAVSDGRRARRAVDAAVRRAVPERRLNQRRRESARYDEEPSGMHRVCRPTRRSAPWTSRPCSVTRPRACSATPPRGSRRKT